MPSTDLATIYGRRQRAVDLSVCDGGHTGRTRAGRAAPTQMIHVISATSDCDGRRCLRFDHTQPVTRDFLSVERDGVFKFSLTIVRPVPSK